MSKDEVISALSKARPICDTEDFVIDEHNKAVDRATVLIKKAKDPYLMMVLSKKYLEGKSIKEIAYEMQCGKTTVHRLINEAIEEIVRNASKRKKTN